ncbi:Chromosomal replication initiator protein DnaA [Candidatus Entotheonellaceae bacterium PAL068K]
MIEDKCLRSRFEWRLIADLQAPDLETKIAILKIKAEYMQMWLPDEVAWLIAHRMRGDVRKLEGALNVIEAYTAMTGQEITVGLVQNLIGEISGDENKPITIPDISPVVADHYKLRSTLLRSKKRTKEVGGGARAPCGHVPGANSNQFILHRKSAKILVTVTIRRCCMPATRSRAGSTMTGASRRKSSSSCAYFRASGCTLRGCT